MLLQLEIEDHLDKVGVQELTCAVLLLCKLLLFISGELSVSYL